jgi:hypothetical protein
MTGAARRKAEEDCSDERSILRRMSPVVALFGRHGMSDMRPECAPKRTPPPTSEFMMGWTPRRRHRCAKVEVLSTT